MSRLARLKAATSLSDLARLLDFKPKGVSYILYKQPAATKYKTFQIPKRNGGQRTIKAPIDALKVLQRKLSDLLQDCVDEINIATKRKDRTAHGFKRKRSIITNARQHRHRRWVFNLDLEDFFPSINFGRVRGFLLKSRDFELHEDVATVIAQIACHENSLPQGSPCSPVIANEKINVRWEYRHNVRAMVHSLVKTGTFELLGVTQKDGEAVLEKRPGTLNELHGMLGFIDSIEVYNKTQTGDSPPEKKSSREKIYREFLLYSTFYATKMPVIICEGQTDNVYLTHAIKSLAAEFPDLAEVMPDKKIKLKMRLYKYPRSSTARLLGLKDGGSAVLSKFIGTYKRGVSHFTAPGLANPVVILYDNDSGGDKH